MANKTFSHVLLMGREGIAGVPETLEKTHQYLNQQGVKVSVESNSSQLMSANHQVIADHEISADIDLIIVIGGDGSLLHAAHIAEQYALPVLGVHRGRLGFLTDIPPDAIEQIGPVIQGQYLIDKRHFFVSEFTTDNNEKQKELALNEVVLLPSDTAHMIEFDTYANNELIYEHRADGLIISTPTGSTAYALSGGGPILHPSIDATILLPMFPHTLSSRPIVIDGSNQVRVHINDSNDSAPHISFDGRNKKRLQLNSDIIIQKHQHPLTLIHPEGYSYFQTLREKLGWERRARRT